MNLSREWIKYGLDLIQFISDNIQKMYIIRYKMKTDLLHPFKTLPYFTLEGFKQIAGMDNPHQVRMLISRWTKAGHILQLKRGVYMTRRFYDQRRADKSFSAAISAVILQQSYVSLEYILQRNNILTEVTYPVTCVTVKNTRKITNIFGTFLYRHVNFSLYHGFTFSEYYGIRYAEASVAKALFDYIYLRPLPTAFRSLKINLAEELRLNLDELTREDRDEFASHVINSKKRKMEQIYDNFRRWIWRP